MSNKTQTKENYFKVNIRFLKENITNFKNNYKIYKTKQMMTG
jgi:hypothetical protein